MKYVLWIVLLLAGIVFALIYLLGFSKLHLGSVYSYILAINLTTFLYYGIDKLSAKINRIRIPEMALHIMSFLGGSPLALVAQQLFWHKTTKRSFQLVYWFIVCLQCGMYYVLFHTDILKDIM